MLFQTHKAFVHLRNTIETFLEKIIKILKRFMAQKGSKDIVKIVHVTVFQLQFYEAT